MIRIGIAGVEGFNPQLQCHNSLFAFGGKPLPLFLTPTRIPPRSRLPFWPRALLLDLAVDLRLMFTFHTLVMIDCNTVYFCVKTWHLSTRVANVAGFSNALNVDYDIIIRVFVGIAFCIAFTVKFVHVKSSNKCT